MKHVPLLGPLFFFEWEQHLRALFKAIITWALVTSPIFIAILLTTKAQTPGITSTGFARLGDTASYVFHEFFVHDGIFVYAAAFIAPFLYLGCGRIREAKKTPTGHEMRSIFAHYWWYFGTSLLLLGITGVAFAARHISDENYKSMVVFELVQDRETLLYVTSLYFWYLSILDELLPEKDYNATSRDRENRGAEAFKKRIEGGSS